MRTMYDSTNAVDIPAGSELVAGYVDGSSAWTDADWRRFPGRRIVRICIFNDRLDAHVIDIEPGNNDADGALPWIAAKWRRGEVPTVYCFSDAGPQGFRISDVRIACDAAGVRRPLFWIAMWDNNPDTFDPSGDAEIIAKQYANPTLTGGHYDASIVADLWPGVDEPPVVEMPQRIGQSADLVLAVRELGHVQPIFRFIRRDGTAFQRGLDHKVIATRPGRYIVTLYPPVDPDADETLALDDSATFVVDVI